MKKLFSLLAAVLLAGSMMAGTATLTIEDFAATSFTDQASGISVTTAKNGGGTEPAYNATGKDLRVYAKGSVTIEAAQNITAISFTISTQGKRRLAPLTANVGEVAVVGTPDFTAEWTGSATSVTITVGDKADYGTDGNAKAGQLDFTAIVVTFDGEGGGEPIVVEYDTINVAEAIVIANALENGKTSTDKYFVEGFAVNVAAYSSEYKNQDFFMVDNATAPDSVLMAFRAAPKKAGQAYPVLAGDKVLAFGKLKKYVKNDVVQLEIDQPSVEFLEEVEGDRTIEEPEPVVPDTITVARALAIGDSIGQGKTTAEQYVVDGYVISAEAFYQANKNQTWTMADDAAAESATFKAYRCVPVFNNDTVKVLKGDKVRLCGKIQNYNGTIEISYAKAEFLSMAEGDHSTAEPVQEELDTITVARALEIGEALEAGKSSDSIYVIAGYVSKIITAYDTASKNESFWMVDTMGSRAASNAAGAFEVYRGKMDTIAEQDAMVYVKAKIYKYQPMKNNQPNGDPVIETASNPIPEVHVAVAGHAEVIESINVARAMEIGLALPAGSTSGDRYEITGYVSSIEAPFSEQYKNETFWITDDSTSTANSTADGAFYVYRGKPNTQAEIGMHAKIKIVCYIVNYSGKIENDNANNAFEVLKQGEELKYDTISVADAITKTQTLNPGATSSETYVVKGYLVNISDPYSSQYKNMSFYIDDEYPAEDNKFQCYRASIADTDVEKAVLGAYVAVTGKLDNNSHGLQMASGAKVEFLPAPQIDTIEVTVAQAVEVAAGLEPLVKTADWYSVTGYVSELESEYNEEYGTQSFWLANEKGGVSAFHAFQAKLKMAVAVGQEVVIFGKIMRFDDPVLETIEARMEGGRVTKIDGQDQGIENIVLTEKAQKVLVEGQIFIIRDNKLYNLQGARVR